MSTNTILQQAGFRLVVAPPLVSTSDALGTAPMKVVLQDFTQPALGGGRPRTYSVDLVNPNATALIAWQLVTRGSAAPTISATYVAATPSGAPVLPSQTKTIIFSSEFELWVVADTAASKFAATITMY